MPIKNQEALRLKICGLTRGEDACLAAELGAWALGFILWPGSKRAISPKDVGAIVAELQQRVICPANIVGVFVNATQDEIAQAVIEAKLTVVQLHGDEPPSLSQSLPYRVWQAARPKVPSDVTKLADYDCEAFVIDAAVKGHYGGTGTTADWQLALAAQRLGPTILSGGLNPENLAQAASTVAAYAYDLASGVEVEPGIKSADLLRKLFKVAAATAG